MKKILNIISVLFGFHSGQILLEKINRISLYLMGIGSGSGVDDSGEKSVFRKLSDIDINEYCILDVGANKGQFLNMASKYMVKNNKKFHIHSFEPSKSTYQSLLNNTTSLQNITLNNLGLSDKFGEAILYYDAPGSGLASLVKRDLGFLDRSFDCKEAITLSTVDAYCNEKNITEIHLLKIDVEGHELNVIKGAERMIKENKIRMITFEFGGCNVDTSTYFRNFYDFFMKENYSIYRITPSGYLFLIDKYKETREQFITTNFLAIKNA